MTLLVRRRVPRRTATAIVAVTGALALASCGSPHDEPTAAAIDPPGDPAVGPAAGSDQATAGPEEDAESPATEAPTTAPPTTDTPTTEPPGTDDPEQDPSDRAPGEIVPVDVTWPSTWIDFSFTTAEFEREGVELQVYGVINPTFSTNGIVSAYSAAYAGGSSYEEMLRVGGTDVDALTALPDREISGFTATAYEQTSDSGDIPITQHLYGIELDDGGFVEVVFSAATSSFAGEEATFGEILDSIVIHD